MYLSGISVRKIAGVTEALSRVKVGKDAVSRIARRLEDEQRALWRERPLEEKAYPYLYLDATYLKVRWGASVRSMALLACVGVDEEGFREVSWRWRLQARRRAQRMPPCSEGYWTGASREH